MSRFVRRTAIALGAGVALAGLVLGGAGIASAATISTPATTAAVVHHVQPGDVTPNLGYYYFNKDNVPLCADPDHGDFTVVGHAQLNDVAQETAYPAGNGWARVVDLNTNVEGWVDVTTLTSLDERRVG